MCFLTLIEHNNLDKRKSDLENKIIIWMGIRQMKLVFNKEQSYPIILSVRKCRKFYFHSTLSHVHILHLDFRPTQYK